MKVTLPASRRGRPSDGQLRSEALRGLRTNKSLTMRGQDVPNHLVLILGPDSASRALSPSVQA